MLRRFVKDRGGNFAIMTAIALLPVMGALTIAIDYSEMSRRRQEMYNALDAAGIATGRQIVKVSSETELIKYAEDFFEASLTTVKPTDTSLHVTLPQNNTGGGTLRLCATLTYHPYFLPAFTAMLGKDSENFTFDTCTDIRLKNTLEVALVLDNSGSMSELGSGSTKTRLELLKLASTQLVDTIAKEGETLKQIPKPVQFAVVPFAASVNVGSTKDTASWMDTTGISPVHHENFNWTNVAGKKLATNKYAEKVGSVWYKRGAGWGTTENKPLTRFSLFKDLQVQVTTKINGKNVTSTVPYSSWQGCVESRPSPYNVTDEEPKLSNPASLFVPMFAPDEPDGYSEYDNSWFPDFDKSTVVLRQRDMQKYYKVNAGSVAGWGAGPNLSCTTQPISPLVDVTTGTGKADVKASINAMTAGGNTNVPEGMAWGWRTVSHAEPFTEGRPDEERGNDKVVIVLTDGANTYGDLSNSSSDDPIPNRSTYAAYGYAGMKYNGGADTRIYKDTTVTKTTFTAANYTEAMNQHFSTLCTNAKKPKTPGFNDPHVIVMTVALDLDSKNTTEKKQIDALQACSSFSRVNPTKKLFWNATGGELDKVFKEIADELSNLRVVS